MDIGQIKQELAQDEETVTFTVYDKADEPYLGSDRKPATISVVGSDAKRYTDARQSIQRAALRTHGKPTPDETIQRIRDNRIALAAAAITGWSGWESDGQPFPCTPENAAVLLSANHILEQVENAIGKHATLFTKRSAR
jgi:hypothetical protein